MTENNLAGVSKNTENNCKSSRRLPYISPQLTPLGDIAVLTHNVGQTGNPDGSQVLGRRSSGL